MNEERNKKKSKKDSTIGIYFGKEEIEEFRKIQEEADKYRMYRAAYVRRALDIGRAEVAKNPLLLIGMK